MTLQYYIEPGSVSFTANSACVGTGDLRSRGSANEGVCELTQTQPPYRLQVLGVVPLLPLPTYYNHLQLHHFVTTAECNYKKEINTM